MQHLIEHIKENLEVIAEGQTGEVALKLDIMRRWTNTLKTIYPYLKKDNGGEYPSISTVLKSATISDISYVANFKYYLVQVFIPDTEFAFDLIYVEHNNSFSLIELQVSRSTIHKF